MNFKLIGKLTGMTLVFALALIVFFYLKGNNEQWWFCLALVFYYSVGIVIGLKTQRAVVSDSNSQFFTGVMGAIGIRMLLCLVFLSIYLMVSEIKSKEFIVFYLILYLFYTIFEISQLVSKLRAEKSSNLDNTTS
jgi:phosphatidylserine synthase